MGIVMMQPGQKVLDYSWARPDVTRIYADGIYSGVIRYVGWEPQNTDIGDKIISKEECDKICDAGLTLALVFQMSATRAGTGAENGHTDGVTAVAHAQHLGYEGVLFVAVDFDATPLAVAPYVEAFCAAVEMYEYASGVYGGFRIVESLALPTYRWQTEAWSYGQVSDKAHIIQRIMPGPYGTTDVNDILKPVPFWNSNVPTNLPHHNIPGKVKAMWLVQLMNEQVILTDGWKGRKLFDDGTEFAFLRDTVQLPVFDVQDQWVDLFYRQLAGIA